MGRKKLYDVKVNLSLPSDLGDWIDAMVTNGKFSSRSHAIRRCVRICKDNPEVTAKL